jgi:formylmethanofuran dehydrogenase subunit B
MVEVHEDVVCAFCGCLCDDLKVEVEDNIITKVSHVCTIGRNKLMHSQSDLASLRVNGHEATWEEAIAEAADILTKAKAPLVYGLSSTTTEAISEAVALTEMIEGTVDNPSSY